MLVVLFTGCSHKTNLTQSKYASLEGSFSAYHAALGSGNGMLFRVTLPASIAQNFKIDSFYLKGESHAFTITKRTDTGSTVLEANLYVAEKSPVDGGTNIMSPDPASKKITDSIFIARKFYPSWIIGTGAGNSKKDRFDILSYKEIIRQVNN